MSDLKCAKCDKGFTAGAILTALEKKWHQECFVCSGCNAQLHNQSFHCKDETPFCVACWKERFQPKCATCGVVIDPSEQYMTYNEKAYHKGCFTCDSCKQTLAGKQFCIKDNKYFCPEHV
ncbi:unnamed protein product [Protopolystoma xenopodis]|uniref:LIM zinc-binding domain-containing protein n=1 Tax=Protopolystoma xenopodis TaxID=117903 RepID=A0A3S5AW50_9PLAT|nr:unnamed protein product [Protopolystoma xenopodis]